MNTYSRSKHEAIKDSIDKLDANEHLQIFSIIKKFTSNYTRTQTEVFVSSDILNDTCIAEVEKYIHFCVDQRKRMEEDNKTRKGYERLMQVSHD
jgi:hypothetical protein